MNKLASSNLSGCFDEGRTPDECCPEPPDVLIFAPPKTASTFLLQSVTNPQNGGLRSERTHTYDEALYMYDLMKAPCTLVTIARNLFYRNPSQFFYQLLQPPPRIDHGPWHAMQTERWASQEEVLRATDEDILPRVYDP